MSRPSRPFPEFELIRNRANIERTRAVRAATIANRHERLSASAKESLRAFHTRIAGIHRTIELRHLTAARLHEMHADRLMSWTVEAAAGTSAPRFIASVASMLGARSAGITLLGPDREETSVVSSDSMAAAAQELEFALGEGPVHDATAAGRVVLAPEEAPPDRWPYYWPAVRELGVRSVAVAPLCLPATCLGALAVFDPVGRTSRLATALVAVADALTHTVLLSEESTTFIADEDPVMPARPTGLLLDDADPNAVTHQAVGMVAAQCACSTDDALAIIKARAFAENERVGSIARKIVDRRIRFDDPVEG